MFRKYDVVDPPSARELAKAINNLRTNGLGKAAMSLVVIEKLDDLSARRSENKNEHPLELVIENIVFGNSPFIIGYVGDESQHARLDVVSEYGVADDERPLSLSVFDISEDS